MSRSPIARLVRPAILLVAGMLLGQGALAVAAPSAPAATTQVRITSCAGMNFRPIDSATGYTWTGRRLERGNGGDGWFLCDPQLPHRAVVTKVRFTVYDSSSLNEVRYCALVRHGLAAANSEPVAIAGVAATGVGAEPGSIRLTDTSILTPTIDNGNFAYWLQCLITGGASLTGLIGADVTYRISSANG